MMVTTTGPTAEKPRGEKTGEESVVTQAVAAGAVTVPPTVQLDPLFSDVAKVSGSAAGKSARDMPVCCYPK